MPGGITIADALAHAQENLLEMRESCLAHIDEMLVKLRAGLDSAQTPSPDTQIAMYRDACELLTSAVTHDLIELSAATHSLCDLLDRQLNAGAWNRKAVEVHLSSMALLRSRSNDAESTGRKEILNGLRQVVSKLT